MDASRGRDGDAEDAAAAHADALRPMLCAVGEDRPAFPLPDDDVFASCLPDGLRNDLVEASSTFLQSPVGAHVDASQESPDMRAGAEDVGSSRGALEVSARRATAAVAGSDASRENGRAAANIASALGASSAVPRQIIFGELSRGHAHENEMSATEVKFDELSVPRCPVPARGVAVLESPEKCTGEIGRSCGTRERSPVRAIAAVVVAELPRNTDEYVAVNTDSAREASLFVPRADERGEQGHGSAREVELPWKEALIDGRRNNILEARTPVLHGLTPAQRDAVRESTEKCIGAGKGGSVSVARECSPVRATVAIAGKELSQKVKWIATNWDSDRDAVLSVPRAVEYGEQGHGPASEDELHSKFSPTDGPRNDPVEASAPVLSTPTPVQSDAVHESPEKCIGPGEGGSICVTREYPPVRATDAVAGMELPRERNECVAANTDSVREASLFVSRADEYGEQGHGFAPEVELPSKEAPIDGPRNNLLVASTPVLRGLTPARRDALHESTEKCIGSGKGGSVSVARECSPVRTTVAIAGTEFPGEEKCIAAKWGSYHNTLSSVPRAVEYGEQGPGPARGDELPSKEAPSDNIETVNAGALVAERAEPAKPVFGQLSAVALSENPLDVEVLQADDGKSADEGHSDAAPGQELIWSPDHVASRIASNRVQLDHMDDVREPSPGSADPTSPGSPGFLSPAAGLRNMLERKATDPELARIALGVPNQAQSASPKVRATPLGVPYVAYVPVAGQRTRKRPRSGLVSASAVPRTEEPQEEVNRDLKPCTATNGQVPHGSQPLCGSPCAKTAPAPEFIESTPLMAAAESISVASVASERSMAAGRCSLLVEKAKEHSPTVDEQQLALSAARRRKPSESAAPPRKQASPPPSPPQPSRRATPTPPPPRPRPDAMSLIPAPSIATTPELLEAANLLGPLHKLPGFRACLPRRSSARSAPGGPPTGLRKGRNRGSRKNSERSIDEGVVQDEPMLADLLGYEPKYRSCVFASAIYNGVTYRVGDHVALHTGDKDAPQWIVVCEGFYASTNNVPMFHGRWYWSVDDVRRHGGLASKARLTKLSKFELFSTDARDENLVESISELVTVLSAKEFEKLHRLDPALVDVPGVYFCSKLYSTETGEVSPLSSLAFPGDAVPSTIAKKKDAILRKKVRQAPLPKQLPSEPVRMSKRRRSGPRNLLMSIGNAGYDGSLIFEANSGTDETGECNGLLQSEEYRCGREGKNRRQQ
jgi:hypothetical protein